MNSKILMSTHDRVLIFDDKGFYLGKSEETPKCIRSERKQKICYESNQNNDYGKFLLVENLHDGENQ